jgi:hypothetical protein
MIAYFAASWSRRVELRKLRDRLMKAIPGLVVNSRWLDMEPATSASDLRFRPVPSSAVRSMRQQRAEMDEEDVAAADILVRFTDDLSATTVPSYLATGSRMVEMGIALALQHPVIVVGGTQPIFDYLPRVQHVKNIVVLKRILRKIQRASESNAKESAKILKRVLRKLDLAHGRACMKLLRQANRAGY